MTLHPIVQNKELIKLDISTFFSKSENRRTLIICSLICFFILLVSGISLVACATLGSILSIMGFSLLGVGILGVLTSVFLLRHYKFLNVDSVLQKCKKLLIDQEKPTQQELESVGEKQDELFRQEQLLFLSKTTATLERFQLHLSTIFEEDCLEKESSEESCNQFLQEEENKMLENLDLLEFEEIEKEMQST